MTITLWVAAALAIAAVPAVNPLARRWARPHARFAILLRSTGLTFGTISASCGYTAGVVTRGQLSVVAWVVVVAAVVHTAIAQRFFAPQLSDVPPVHPQPVEDEENAIYRRRDPSQS